MKKMFCSTDIFVKICAYDLYKECTEVSEKNKSIFQEDIDSLHALYVQSVRDLYNEYNPIHGDPRVKLNII